MIFSKHIKLKKQAVIALLVFTLAGCGSTNTQRSSNVVKPSVYTKALQGSAYQKDIQQYKAQYEADPDNLKALLGLARTYRNAGQTNHALQTLKNAEEHFGNHPAFLTEIGKVNLAAGNIREGIKALESAVNGYPENWEAYSALGIAYDFEGRFDKSIDSYTKALEICPGSASILNNMGISTGMTGDIVMARSLLLKASSLQPQSKRIKKNLSLFRQLEIKCRKCDASDYQSLIKSAIVSQDWAYGDLACTTGAQEIIEVLNDNDFIDVRVEFEFDKAELLPKAIETLTAMAEAFSSEQLKGYNFDLEGHTDAVGTEKYNQILSQRRAAAVKQYLSKTLGIDESRLNAVGYGETRLLDKEHPENGANRRVRILKLK